MGVRAASDGPSREEIERISFCPRFPTREAAYDITEDHVQNYADEEQGEQLPGDGDGPRLRVHPARASTSGQSHDHPERSDIQALHPVTPKWQTRSDRESSKGYAMARCVAKSKG